MAGTDNHTVGEVRASYDAARIASLQQSLDQATEACEKEGLYEDYRADLAEAHARKEAAAAVAAEAREALSEELLRFNSALRTAETINDSLDLAGAVATVIGIFATGGTSLAIGAAVTSATTGAVTLAARPAPTDARGLVGTASGQALNVAGLLTSRTPAGLLTRAGGTASASGTLISSYDGARQLSFSQRSLEGLRNLRTELDNLEPTVLEGLNGADAGSLSSKLDASIEAEEKFVEAHEAWAKALDRDVDGEVATCIGNGQRAIEAAGPESLDRLLSDGEDAMIELNGAAAAGQPTAAAEQTLISVRNRMLQRIRRLAPAGG
jgi:hypothetical protein